MSSIPTAKPVMNKYLLMSCLLLVSACAQQPPPQNTMTLCDGTGCAEVPRNYASFQPKADPAEAQVAALENLAAQDPRAAYDLALRFFRADGVRQDTYRSIKWMREAAEKGFLPAQMALGRVYLTGLQEMGSDPGEAEKWLSITYNRGDREAGELLRQATLAKQSQQAQYQIMNQWRTMFYNSWNSGYRYNWYWNQGAWMLH